MTKYLVTEEGVYRHRAWLGEFGSDSDAIKWCRGIASVNDSYHRYELREGPAESPADVDDGRFIGWARGSERSDETTWEEELEP